MSTVQLSFPRPLATCCYQTSGSAQRAGEHGNGCHQYVYPLSLLARTINQLRDFIELLIHSYFNIIKREMIDMVPKAISLTLVNHSKENLQRELLQELYKAEVLDDLLKESEHVVTRRKEAISMIQALNKAEE